MTIEERATEFANATIVKSTNFIVWNQVRLRYIEIVTERDRIARKEERGRCIELWCKSCAAYGSGVCSPNGCSHKKRFVEYLRKAIKEGGEV